jgi:hypothetical protein
MPSRNLSLALLHDAQISAIRFAADVVSPNSADSLPQPIGFETDKEEESLPMLHELLGRLAQIKGLAMPDPEYLTSRICSADDHLATLHEKVAGLWTLDAEQLAAFRDYLDAVEADVTPAEIMAGPKLIRWKKCLLNDAGNPQALYRAYIRSSAFEKPECRDSTYIRYEINLEHQSVDSDDQSEVETVTRFARVRFFASYTTAAGAKHLMAYVEDIPVVFEYVGASTSRKRLYQTKETLNAPQKNKTKDRQMLFINADHIGALVGLVVLDGAGYFFEKDTCFVG